MRLGLKCPSLFFVVEGRHQKISFFKGEKDKITTSDYEEDVETIS